MFGLSAFLAQTASNVQTAETAGTFWQRLSVFFENFDWMSGAGIALVYVLIYFTSKTMRKSDATKLMLIYWGLLLSVSVMACFTEVLISSEVYFLICLLISMFMLILFSTEIKREFWNKRVLKRNERDKIVSRSGDASSPPSADDCIAQISTALRRMVKDKVGALIVLSNGKYPEKYFDGGVYLNANISAPLIETIFYKGTALHDGAMVIYNHKIQAAGCTLPLTEKNSLIKIGMRHRAALGISEACKVTVLVVSEETGAISIVRQGSEQRYADQAAVETCLRQYYAVELSLHKKEKPFIGTLKKIFLDGFWVKFVSLFLAFMVVFLL